MKESRDTRFSAFVAARGDHYLRIAIALTGNRQAGEDLFQTALERTVRRIRREAVVQDMDSYLRRTLVNGAIDGARRRKRRPEHATHPPPVASYVDVRFEEVETKDSVLQLLSALPPLERAVVCLRVLDDLSVEETARTLGVSEGTIKSQLSRALARLRRSMPEQERTS